MHRGVIDLARATGAVILPVLVLPSGRWILTRARDRMQVPRPFCRVRLLFGAPLESDEVRASGGAGIRR